MKHPVTRITSIVSIAALALFSCIPACAAATEWKIDSQHSAAQFSVRHLAISTVRGAFSKVAGTVLVDDQDISKSSVTVTIDVSTVDTREPARDKDLRSDHFFDVDHFPTMTFKSTKVEQVSPGKLKIIGDLTIRGDDAHDEGGGYWRDRGLGWHRWTSGDGDQVNGAEPAACD